MFRLRIFFLRHRSVFAIMLALALAMKAFLPAGYMLSPTSDSFTVSVCSGMAGQQTMITIPKQPRDAEKNAVDRHACHAGAADQLTLGGADPFLLATAIAFILALGFAPVSVPERRSLRFQTPPLRGPPALI
ncbi:hypothetical protein GV829_12740 [Sphingomonas lacunae]|uniref:DUF2946 domain-containing protein n=1 Tax=Sphingomonas lacunae TaxID=2698828 RepID=A0A6M4AVN1_9SPHN|nr:hypothetical protein [Sphingomonas lacunae]QJQ33197.1 hypothetical protein GV829_12740 [Sphingomonas lacunae]